MGEEPNLQCTLRGRLVQTVNYRQLAGIGMEEDRKSTKSGKSKKSMVLARNGQQDKAGGKTKSAKS